MQYRQNNNTNKVIGAFILTNLVVTGYFSVQFFGSWINYYKQTYTTTNTYPTSLPWISTKSDCEHRGRDWRNGKCWDSEHDMLF
ncbi:hypothetical protein NIES4071_05010 [Calothrix sp. NIES-4071]|nr:hypothetical protein NIES4071_05010 [Calothrix sp. NIES-4071]BAZ54847.1 hypothetical protein NIES4105_05000 [Calothrix sp. NIES-4105]